ncbi:AfsR/SARP family transcriptional regulator [Antrihabitans cavernicola]|nr:AfsR/SARP family transcriptional regulator [Spelaeibacter cavernicola]
MDVKVLGPFAADLDGRSIVPSAPKPRQLLTLLALRRSSIVTHETLIDELWGDRVPSSAPTTIQTYVMKLRKIIDSTGEKTSGKGVLVTRSGGYSLDIAGNAWSIDLEIFRHHSQEGTLAFNRGDFERASDQLELALNTWSGPAFQDVRKGEVLAIEAVRVEAERVAALEQKINADIMLNNLPAAIAELQALIRTDPLNENFCALYMLAAYRSGCAAQSISAFHNLKDQLATELGIDPGPICQNLFSAVLQRSEELDSFNHVIHWAPRASLVSTM